MKPELFFWVDGEVIAKHWMDSPAVIRGVPTVDLSDTEPYFRYGEFLEPEGWRHIPKEEFPKEFLMHLLLMGIS